MILSGWNRSAIWPTNCRIAESGIFGEAWRYGTVGRSEQHDSRPWCYYIGRQVQASRLKTRPFPR
jgi:hypothetical protein